MKNKKQIARWALWILGASIILMVLGIAFRNALEAFRSRQVTGALSYLIELKEEKVFDLDPFLISWKGETNGQVTITHKSNPSKVIWSTLPGESFVQAAMGNLKVQESKGSFLIREQRQKVFPHQLIESISMKEGQLDFRGTLKGGDGEPHSYSLVFIPADSDRLQINLTVFNPEIDHLFLTYGSRSEEHFFGFGEQFSHFDMKGKRLPIVVQEQGIGRGKQPLTFLVDLVAKSGGSWHSSYAAVPQYITSDMHAFFLENYAYSIFDLREPDRVQVQVFDSKITGQVITGESPAELIEAYTRFSGRMKPLPDWIHRGAIIGMQGGTAKVQKVREQMAAHNVPVAGFWLQDWVGQRTTSFGKQLWWNWELDRDRYPDWDSLVTDLGRDSIYVLTYVNPFLADVSEKPNHRRNLFQEAKEQDFLVRNEAGEPYMIPNTSFSAGLIDISNPKAVNWIREVISKELVGVGAKGWMADFGEALPWDAVMKSGSPGSLAHNAYPEEWAAINRQVVDSSHSPEKLVFFSRSGYTRSPGYSTLFWAGDQLVDWDAHDGIKTAVTAMVSSGISGFSLNHSDIGGYTTLTDWPLDHHRDKELLLRWMELSAFTPLFRSHEGNRPDANAQIYDDSETMAHFGKFARIFKALMPYRKQLMQEASLTGMPVVRAPFLHYPEDTATYHLSYEQFMLGPSVMVAPVLDPGAAKVSCYLPAGSWTHLWSGEIFSLKEGKNVEIEAPLGEPGIFYLEEVSEWMAILPTL